MTGLSVVHFEIQSAKPRIPTPDEFSIQSAKFCTNIPQEPMSSRINLVSRVSLLPEVEKNRDSGNDVVSEFISLLLLSNA